VRVVAKASTRPFGIMSTIPGSGIVDIIPQSFLWKCAAVVSAYKRTMSYFISSPFRVITEN
jgi:hypothetical protein